MKMSIGELRRVICEQLEKEEDDEEGPVAAPWQVMDALVDDREPRIRVPVRCDGSSREDGHEYQVITCDTATTTRSPW